MSHSGTRPPPVRAVLSDPNAFATTLLATIIDRYTNEVLSWSPVTVRMETEDDFNFTWPQANFDRLMVAFMLVKTDDFYKNLPDFIEMCNVLSGSPATPAVFDPADALECAWGITEALLLAPPEPDDEEPFAEEIRAYIGEALKEEGIITPPDILQIGIVRDGLKNTVHSNFSDDPTLFCAIWEVQAEKTEEINAIVKERLTGLVDQLSKLRLKNGKTAEVSQRMLQRLSSVNKNLSE